MYYPKWLLALLTIIGAVMLGTSDCAVPIELSRLDSKDASSFGQHDLTTLDRRDDGVPLLICSWKPFPDSPAKHKYDRKCAARPYVTQRSYFGLPQPFSLWRG